MSHILMMEITLKNLKANARPQLHLNEMDVINDKYDVDVDNYLSDKLLPMIEMQSTFMNLHIV